MTHGTPSPPVRQSDRLGDLVADTHVHAHKENSIQFPAAIADQRRLDTSITS